MKNVIIVPTYNERENIKPLIEDIFKHVPEVDIFVVDDNSPDGTALMVREIMNTNKKVSLLLRNRKEGLGKAYLHAFTELEKRNDIEAIITMDADFSHSPAYLPKMLELAKNHDVVIGSRYIGRGSGTEGWEFWRRLLSRLGNLYCRFVTGNPVHDTTAGFILISKKMLNVEQINKIELSGYAFHMELKYMLWKNGANIVEMPIIFRNRHEGKSKMSNHIIAEGLLAPWKMRLRKKITCTV